MKTNTPDPPDEPAESTDSSKAAPTAETPENDSVSFVYDAEMSASSEETVPVTHEPAPKPSTSQRRLVPPDGKPLKWWSRYRRQLAVVEWTAIAFFLALFAYFLYLLVFPPQMDSAADWRIGAEPGRWQYIVIHHSATVGGSPEAFDRFHREQNGWENGLGYHFVIGNGNGMDDGEIAVGHRWREQMDGAHVQMRGEGKANVFSIGVALVGDFDKKPPTPAQLASLIKLVRFLTGEYGVPLTRIAGHNQVAVKHTECPGKLFPMTALLRFLESNKTLEAQ